MADVADFESIVQQVDGAALTPIVRRALSDETLEVAHWEYAALTEGSGGGWFNSAVYRFSGRCDNERMWSLILKLAHEQPVEHPHDSHYWKREYEAYQSGWLKDLPCEHLAAPCCYHTQWQAGGPVMIWLEDLSGLQRVRSAAQLVTAARHLGQFNGVYLVRDPLPDYGWMSRHWIRNDMVRAAQRVHLLEKGHDNPYWKKFWHPQRQAEFHRVFNERERFCLALEHLPKTVVHMDAFSRNLFTRQVNGLAQTVAVDWAFVGIEALGTEIVALVLVSLIFGDVPVDMAELFERQVFDAYVAGLRAADWRGDVADVRLVFTAALALRHIDFAFHAYTVLSKEGDADLGALVDTWNALSVYVDALTQEARSLVGGLRQK
jgi:hypothetical protein